MAKKKITQPPKKVAASKSSSQGEGAGSPKAKAKPAKKAPKAKAKKTPRKPTKKTKAKAKKVGKAARAIRDKLPPQQANRFAIKPEDYDVIAEMHLSGCTQKMIADKFGVSMQAVQNTMKLHIFPAFQSQLGNDRGTHLAKLDLIYRTAWVKFQEGGNATAEEWEQLKESEEGYEKLFKRIKKPEAKHWLDLAVECLKERAKLLGLYEPEKTAVDIGLRVAGQSTTEMNRNMMTKLYEQVVARAEYEETVAKALGRN